MRRSLGDAERVPAGGRREQRQRATERGTAARLVAPDPQRQCRAARYYGANATSEVLLARLDGRVPC